MAQTVSQPRPAAVAAVLARASTWTSARRKPDGKPFFFILGSTAGAVYMTAADGCTCPAAQRSADGNCKHQAAVRQRQAPAPRRRTALDRLNALYPKCKSCDDLADSRDGFCDRCASDREWQARREQRAS